MLGHYRILEPIGEGGMGEVYAAEDTRLHRRVALKVLPGLLAADPERRLRFEREAQTIAALNHPNIVTIHSVEEANGTLFLTMELVDGKPLSEMIPRSGLPVGTALKIAIGISDAMAAAQQRGITHRDLKPANVMLTADGRVKVLDFGVAKLRDLEIAGAAEDLTVGPTRQLTGEGRIIGTIAYMSPEQAEGKSVDPRSDIFSLGVLLHEMVTGDRPFKGDTNVSIISSILKDTPAPITDLNPALPSDLARIVRRCLAKDPARRYQSAADVRNELEDLKQDVDSGVSTVVTRPASAAAPARSKWKIVFPVVVLALAAASWYLATSARKSAAPAPFTIDHLARLTTSGSVSLAAISPDGRYVVHVKGSDEEPSLWVRQTATTSDVQIVPPAPIVYDGLAFSPDGNYVYYNTYKSPGGGLATLYRIPVLGGPPTIVLADVDSAVAFSPDGRSVTFTRGAPAKATTAVVIANADGSGAREVATLESPNRFQLETPAWSPDGKTLLALAMKGPASAAVFAVDVDRGRVTQVPGDWAALKAVAWLPDGRSFLADATDLNRVTTNLQLWQVSYPAGERTHVTNDLNAYLGVSLSADGLSLATVQTETTAAIEVSALSDLSNWRRVTGEPGHADGTGGLNWLPDGRIVYTSATSGSPQLWIADSDGRNARQLTTLRSTLNPYASPDGRWVYFDSVCEAGRCLYRVAPDGSSVEQITREGREVHPIVSPEGTTVFFSRTANGENRAGRVSAQGGDVTLVSKVAFAVVGISPDGKTLVGPSWSEQHRRSVVGLLDIASGGIRLLPDIPVPTANFTPDGRGLVFPDLTARPVRVMIRPLPDGTARPIGAPIPGLTFAGAISRDGKTIAVSRGTRQSDVVLISAASPKH
jgi:serine/threonine protein kinase